MLQNGVLSARRRRDLEAMAGERDDREHEEVQQGHGVGAISRSALQSIEEASNLLGADTQLGVNPNEVEWEAKLWKQFCRQENPNIFSNLEIAEDGGFSEVSDLWYRTRWLTAVTTMFFILSNLYYIVSVDLNILSGKPASGDLSDDTTKSMFLLTQPVSEFFLGTKKKSDNIIALVELVGLWALLASALNQLCIAHGARSSRKKWFAVMRFFWEILPQLASYSSMRLLHFVTPTVFISETCAAVAETTTTNQEGSRMTQSEAARKWFKFVAFHVICLVIGFDSFLVKIRAAYSSINDTHLTFTNLYQALLFMVQVLGVVRLGTFVQNRLFVFIFAGEDAVMQPSEKARQKIWEALLVRAMWRTFGLAKFVALMLTFDDTDFQRLVLNERVKERKLKRHPGGSLGSQEALLEGHPDETTDEETDAAEE